MNELIYAADAKAILSGSAPLTPAARRLVLDRIHQLERDVAAIQHQACAAARDRDALQALIGNDSHAFTFQSLGQYRANLSQFITQRTET